MAAVIFGADAPARLLVPEGVSQWKLGEFLGTDSTSYANLVLSSIGLVDQESIDIRKCFNDVNHVFAFGRNVQSSILEVGLTLVLAKECGDMKILKLEELMKKYSENRIYKNCAPHSIQLDDINVYGYLIQMSVGTANPATKSVSVKFTFLLDQEA